VLCIIGIGFISFTGNGENGANNFLGDALTFISAIFYALQIIFIGKFQSKNSDTGSLLVIELSTVSVLMIALSLIFELPKGVAVYSLNLDQIINIVYLAVVCTLLAQLCMIYGQKFTTVNQTALISSLEAVFGTFFSVLFKRETLTEMLIIGFSVVFIAMLINELKIDVLKPLIKNKSKK
ncbi:MAG: DMT family transporter, partial [Clostridia bacterium]|nr:DMT family transporter [Clostridia bacterium]